jgi:hypothetical protein
MCTRQYQLSNSGRSNNDLSLNSWATARIIRDEYKEADPATERGDEG